MLWFCGVEMKLTCSTISESVITLVLSGALLAREGDTESEAEEDSELVVEVESEGGE